MFPLSHTHTHTHTHTHARMHTKPCTAPTAQVQHPLSNRTSKSFLFSPFQILKPFWIQICVCRGVSSPVSKTEWVILFFFLATTCKENSVVGGGWLLECTSLRPSYCNLDWHGGWGQGEDVTSHSTWTHSGRSWSRGMGGPFWLGTEHAPCSLGRWHPGGGDSRQGSPALGGQ